MTVFKFRGMDSTDHWITGVNLEQYSRVNPYPGVYLGSHRIKPETLGLCSAMHDHLGQEVYQGDILKYENQEEDIPDEDKVFYMEVIFLNGCFYATEDASRPEAICSTLHEDLNNTRLWRVTKAGNIFENQELLKKEVEP